jgi:hypothetical protein
MSFTGLQTVHFSLVGDSQAKGRFYHLLGGCLRNEDPRFRSAHAKRLRLICLPGDLADLRRFAKTMGLEITDTVEVEHEGDEACAPQPNGGPGPAAGVRAAPAQAAPAAHQEGGP